MRKNAPVLLLLIAVVLILISAYSPKLSHVPTVQKSLPAVAKDELKLIPDPRTAAEKIVNGAKMEALRDVQHDGSYYRISYPNGDVPTDRGACTDVVVRALRNAGCDLQKLMHEDMKRDFGKYPRSYGLSHPDTNIDHRRVPNQMVFFKRHGRELPISTEGEALFTWKPGDIVYWKLLGDRLDHCGVISNDRSPDGVLLVIHNIGESRQEDCLTRWRIIGHFRYP